MMVMLAELIALQPLDVVTVSVSVTLPDAPAV